MSTYIGRHQIQTEVQQFLITSTSLTFMKQLNYETNVFYYVLFMTLGVERRYMVTVSAVFIALAILVECTSINFVYLLSDLISSRRVNAVHNVFEYCARTEYLRVSITSRFGALVVRRVLYIAPF